MPDVETIRPLFILIFYLVIFIIQIILLVKATKKKETKSWIKVFTLEIFSIIISIILWQYYDSLPGYGFMAGLSYLGEVLFSFGSTILSSIMLFITICIKIIIYEKNQKQQGKKYKNPFITIIAVIFIFISIAFLFSEVSQNWGKKETVGTVIDYEEISYYGSGKYWPVFSFNVDNKEYKDTYPRDNTKIGDKVNLYYYPASSEDGKYYITFYRTDNRLIYIPTFIIGISIIFFRFKDNIFNKGENIL